jgi:FdhD protein
MLLGTSINKTQKLLSQLIFDDSICIEEPLEIIIEYYFQNLKKREAISITMRTPGNEAELALGFLYTEGVIDSINEVEKISTSFDCNDSEDRSQQCIVTLQKSKIFQIDKIKRHFYANSSCGVCGKTSIDLSLESCPYILIKDFPQITKQTILKLPHTLRNSQALFAQTGGCHGVALFNTNGDLIKVMEDIGRHNAMDKLIGYILKEKLSPLQNHVIVVSGRASFELIQKSLTVACSIFVAVGAPSSLAISIAKEFNMSLIGFTKNTEANIYCNPQRIIE